MKRLLKGIAGATCVTSVILAGCERPDGSCDIVWTLGFMTLALISGLFLKHIKQDERGR